MVRVAMSMLKADSAIRHRISQSAAELSSSYHGPEADGSDVDDMEITLAPSPSAAGAENEPPRGVPTPEPIPDVTAEILQQQQLAQDIKRGTPDAGEGRKSTASRRTRSRANEPDGSSSSESEIAAGSRHGSTTTMRARRKRANRQGSQTSGGGRRSSPMSSTTQSPTRVLPEDGSESAVQQQTAAARSDSTMKPFGSLASLKRRFVGTPRVHPIGVDGDAVEEPVFDASKPSVFSFDRKAGRSREPSQSTVAAAQGLTAAAVAGGPRSSGASFSDYEFGANLSDNFAGVTFSSGTDTPT